MNGVNAIAGRFQRSGLVRGLLGVALLGVAGILSAAGSAMAAPAANQLLAVSMEAGAATPTVLIQTAQPVDYRYTVYDAFDPVRVVVDFPGMAVAAVPETIVAGPAPLKELRVAKFDLASGSLTRIEIVLAASAEYQVAPDGNNFRVIFPAAKVSAVAAPQPEPVKAAAPLPVAPAAAIEPVASAAAPLAPAPTAARPAATVVKDVSVSPGRALLVTNGNVVRFEHFTLGKPPRLVVDLYGLTPAFKQRSFPSSAGIKQIRVGVYSDKLRFVFDAAGQALPEYQVEKQDDSVSVTWGKALQGATAVPETAGVTSNPSAKIASKTGNPGNPGQQVSVEALEFENHDGRSAVVVTLSAPARVSQPVQEGKLVRFEIKNAVISRSLRRSIDAMSFPSAVQTVTPYLVTDDGKQAVRIAVELKGEAPYSLVEDGKIVKLVVADGAYAEAAPPAVTTKDVALAPKMAPAAGVASESASAAAAVGSAPASKGPLYSGQKISLVFDNIDVRSVLQLIGDVSGMNILASNDVKGEITLRLIDVPWDQALDLVMETANLGKMQEGNVIRIMPIDKIREREQAFYKIRKEEVDEGVLETRAFSISYSKVDDARKFLGDISSQRGSVIADARNKQLIVKDVPSVLEQVADMIKRIDRPERQVMIEARIVEANTDFSRSLGVKWNFQSTDKFNDEDWQNVTAGLGGAFLLPLTNPAAAGAAASITFGALDGNFDVDLRLSALEAQGDGKIVSTPRVTTLNGQKAVISQGTKVPYTTTSQDGTNIQFENAELKLDVTPEINPDGSVILDIKASNSAVGRIYETSNGETPSIDEKRAETKVLVRNGQTTVIGGIFVENERESNTGVPLLKDIPFLGHLFKSTTKQKERRELLIFITPRILES
jgi:type IV pilus assembly protein PilQ